MMLPVEGALGDIDLQPLGRIVTSSEWPKRNEDELQAQSKVRSLSSLIIRFQGKQSISG
jgi:hypothetical protein